MKVKAAPAVALDGALTAKCVAAAAVTVTLALPVIEPFAVYCCTPQQWLEETRRTVHVWSDHPDHPPVVVLAWDPSTGALAEQSEVLNPCLRSDVLRMAVADTSEEMNDQLTTIVDHVRTMAQSGLQNGSPELSAAQNTGCEDLGTT